MLTQLPSVSGTLGQRVTLSCTGSSSNTGGLYVSWYQQSPMIGPQNPHLWYYQSTLGGPGPILRLQVWQHGHPDHQLAPG